MVNPNETPSWDRPAAQQPGAYSLDEPHAGQQSGAQDVAQNAGEQAKDVAQNAGEQAKDVAQNAGEQAKDVANHATDAAKDVAGNAADRAKDVAETAKSEAGDVKDVAVSTTADVVDTAKEQVGNVVEEAKLHGQALLDEGLAQAREQAQVGQAKLAEIARDFTDELGALMRGEKPQEGLATQLVGNAQGFAEKTSNWLEQATPDQVVTDVRRFAARNPFTFMAIAFGVGVVGGRVIRGIQAAKADEPKALPSKLSDNRPQPAQPRREFNTAPVQPAQPQGYGTTGFATDLPNGPVTEVFDQEKFVAEPPRYDAPAQYGQEPFGSQTGNEPYGTQAPQQPYGEERR